MNMPTETSVSRKLSGVVEDSIRSQLSGMIRDLQVEEVDGEVILSGRTGTYYAKQLATHAAMAAQSEMNLKNDIEVL